MKKKILIFGPLSDSGGREVEAGIISNMLSNEFDLSLMSTLKMTTKSELLLLNNQLKWTTIDKVLSKNILITTINLICKYWFNVKEPSYCLTKNKINRLFYNFEKQYSKVIKKQVVNYNYILFTGELTSKWFIEIISIANSKKIPLIVRTTGKIKDVPDLGLIKLFDIEKILVHSLTNSKALMPNINSKQIEIIDQTSFFEDKLLQIKINSKKSLKFGYLGRLSSEKGILELINVFQKISHKLIIAGNGPLKNKVEQNILVNPLIKFVGEVKQDDYYNFFEEIDVLVIPSFEEAGPLVGIEAMAAGKLIISTDVGAMKERLSSTENNFWFDITNPNSLNEVINLISFLDEFEVKRIRELNRKVYLEKYSFDILKKNYLNLFNH